MSNDPSLASEQERRLQDVLAEYIGAMEAGEAPDRAALLERHPDLADELIIFFANQEDLAVRADPTLRGPSSYRGNYPPSAPAPPIAKPRIGGFEILHEMVRGGMGVVYKARQISLDREVALKMILTNKSAAPTLLRRFRTEAEAVARLDHPNIVPIYDIGEIDGDPYFTMKLVEGGSLSSRIDEFRLPIGGKGPAQAQAAVRRKLTRLVDLLATVARAVHHAHQRGILHRDLKPGNILLDGEGRPMVADFGLAKRVDHDSHLTQTLAVIGTASYMAPEQARPTKSGLTVAADVYALGAIFYELLTGRPPLIGTSSFDTLLKVYRELPLPPRQRNSNVPRDLEMICLKCLQKEPGARYGSALDLAEDLEHWRAGEPISLRAPTAAERLWRTMQRHPAALALLGSVVSALAVATVLSLVARDRADAHAAEAESARNEADIARDAAEKASVENRRLLVSGYVANGTRALDGGDPFAALVWYGEALGLDRGDPAREDPHRVRLGAALAAVRDSCRFGSTTKQLGRRLSARTADAWPCFATDARDQRCEQRRSRVRGDGASQRRRTSWFQPGWPSPLHDRARKLRSRMGCGHRQSSHAAARPRQGDQLGRVQPGRRSLGDCRGGSCRPHLGAATGNLLVGPLMHEQPVLFVCFSRDGKRLVTSGGDFDSHKGEVRVWDLGLAKPTARTVSRIPPISWAYLTPDGDHVVAAGGRRTAHLWPLDTNHPEAVGVSVVRVDPNGAVGPDPTRVLKLDGSTARVCDVATGKSVSPALLHGAAVNVAVFSPDGRMVATSARDRTVRVWDAITGKPLTPPLHHGRLVHQAAFSADASRLLTASEDGNVPHLGSGTAGFARVPARAAPDRPDGDQLRRAPCCVHGSRRCAVACARRHPGKCCAARGNCLVQ